MTRDEFASLALGYMEEIAAFSRRLTGHAADADDLLQASYERAFAAWEELQDPRACRVWLFRIARSLFLDRWRATRARSELRLVGPDDVLAPEPFLPPEAVERLDARELEAALASLPEEQREAVLLCDLWGFEYQEIADITGMAIGTVRSRLSRARTKLAALLVDAVKKDGKGGLRS